MIQAGLVKFETLDEQEGDKSQFSSSFRGKEGMIIQVMGTMDEMPTTRKRSQNDETKGKGTMYSSTIMKARVKLKEREEECSHEEKKRLQNLIQI